MSMCPLDNNIIAFGVPVPRAAPAAAAAAAAADGVTDGATDAPAASPPHNLVPSPAAGGAASPAAAGAGTAAGAGAGEAMQHAIKLVNFALDEPQPFTPALPLTLSLTPSPP
jgi:hypothetical protein